ncbi:hypothetical protein YPPY03_0037, partial [Yersinia pestis PY-03]
MRHGRAG